MVSIDHDVLTGLQYRLSSSARVDPRSFRSTKIMSS
jgi:hypothetical protein